MIMRLITNNSIKIVIVGIPNIVLNWIVIVGRIILISIVFRIVIGITILKEI